MYPQSTAREVRNDVGRPKGSPASPAQRAAAQKNLAKGRAKREQMLKDGGETAGSRWARLLDGSLKVEDLSDDEINNMKIKGRGGSSSRRRMPSHLAKAFSDERHRRAQEGLAQLLDTAIQTYKDILTNPEEKASERSKVAKDIIERNLGKTPDRVHLAADTGFSKAVREVFVDRGESEQSMQEELDRLIAEAGGTP